MKKPFVLLLSFLALVTLLENGVAHAAPSSEAPRAKAKAAYRREAVCKAEAKSEAANEAAAEGENLTLTSKPEAQDAAITSTAVQQSETGSQAAGVLLKK